MLLRGFPSEIALVNTGTVAADVRLGIYDQVDGSLLGSFTAQGIAPNAYRTYKGSELEVLGGFTANGRKQYNVKVESAFTGYIQHRMRNNSVNIITDMTTVCPMSAYGGPQAVDDTLSQTFTVNRQTAISVATLTANDLNVGNSTITNLGAPTTGGSANGTLTLSGANLLYTPARAGTVSFTYQLSGSAGLSNTAQVTLSVADGAPKAVDDVLTQTFNVGQQSTISLSTLTANDLNATGASVVIVSKPSNGTLVSSGNSLLYTPTRAGSDTFTYQLTGTQGTSNTALVTLTAVDALPVAVDDVLTQTFTVGQQSTFPLSSLTANDLNAANATVVGISTPSSGTLIQSGTNLLYTPSQAGTAIFTYRLSGSAGYSNTAQVTLTAVSATPVAVNDVLTQTFVVGRQSAILFSTLTANDLNATGASVVNLSSQTSGFALSGSTLLFTPAQAGKVTFTYQLSGVGGFSNIATVTLTVVSDDCPLESTSSICKFGPFPDTTKPYIYGGTLEYSGDSDYILLTNTSGKTLSFSVSSSIPLFIQIRNAAGTVFETIDTSQRNNSVNTYSATSFGSLWFVVSSPTGATGFYSMGAAAVDDFPDTTTTTGRVVSGTRSQLGTPVTGNIESPADTDWFKVTLTAGHKYDINIFSSSVGGVASPRLELRNPAGTSITISGAAVTTSLYGFNYTPTVSGDYYLVAKALSSSATGGYQIEVDILN